MRILVVEDEVKLSSFICSALREEGFTVDALHNGNEVEIAVKMTHFDVLVLDIMIPGKDGLSIVRSLRNKNISTPVLFLTARGNLDERVEGLNAGADDYLTKPFALAELVARVRALGRRSDKCQPVTLKIGDLTLDTVSRVAKRGNRIIELTNREYRFLEFLMRGEGHVRGRMSIYENVWDYDFDTCSNLITVYMARLRDKIVGNEEIKLLHTIRGVGYVMKLPS
jgi:DNA-binding response OmpR family regulator